jgi:hypothetical protein
MVVRAPQARQMVARGEREARNPWNVRKKKYRPGRPTETGQRVCRSSLTEFGIMGIYVIAVNVKDEWVFFELRG